MRTNLGENEPDWHLTPAKGKPLWDLKGQKPTDERKNPRIKEKGAESDSRLGEGPRGNL